MYFLLAAVIFSTFQAFLPSPQRTPTFFLSLVKTCLFHEPTQALKVSESSFFSKYFICFSFTINSSSDILILRFRICSFFYWSSFCTNYNFLFFLSCALWSEMILLSKFSIDWLRVRYAMSLKFILNLSAFFSSSLILIFSS